MFKHLKMASWRTLWILIGLVVVAAMGCSWPGPYIKHDWSIENQFDGYEIFDGYQYFTSGTLDDPRAIVALKPDYALDSPDWTPVKMTPEELAQWIAALKKDSFVEYNTFPNGAKVIGEDGDVAGYYYSVWEFPLVRMPKEKTLVMAAPRAEYRSTNMRIEFSVGDDSRDSH